MIRLTTAFALVVSLSACGGTPTTPSPTTFSISGRVLANGLATAGVSVTITDGIYAGQTRDTDNAGNYRFTDLTPSTMTLRATFMDYFPETKTVTLTHADQFVDFFILNH